MNMALNEDLRNANKMLLSRLRKSQEEISKLIVAAKHSDPRVLSFRASSKPPLTSTVCNRSQSQCLRKSARAMLEAKTTIHKSPGILKRRSASSKVRLPSPKTPTPVKSPSKYRVISKFLQQKSEEGRDLTFCHSPDDQLLLTAEGNSRPIKVNVRTTSPSKATPSRGHKPLQVTFRTPDNKFHDDVEAARRTPPLLGYDWIAGVVDNSGAGTPNQSNSFLEEMKEFRKLNRSECHSKRYWEEMMGTPSAPVGAVSPYRPMKITQKKSPDPSDTRDPRIINYTINNRLFPVPVDPNEDVRPGNASSPRYIRVSIPKSSLISPHRYKAMHKGSFIEGADTLSLPDHCVMGWQHTVPRRAEENQRSAGLDLRSSMKPMANLVGLQLKSGQISMPGREGATDGGVLDASYAPQYKLVQSRNRR